MNGKRNHSASKVQTISESMWLEETFGDIYPPTMLKAGTLRAACPGLHPAGTSTSPQVETPQPLWTACSRTSPHSRWKDILFSLNGISSISLRAHCLLSIHWSPLIRVRFHLLNTLCASEVPAEAFHCCSLFPSPDLTLSGFWLSQLHPCMLRECLYVPLPPLDPAFTSRMFLFYAFFFSRSILLIHTGLPSPLPASLVGRTDYSGARRRRALKIKADNSRKELGVQSKLHI